MSENKLTLKLRNGARLSEEDAARLEGITGDARLVPAGNDVVSEGQGTGQVHFVTSGTACRYKIVEDGRRAIVALLLPGDFCDLHVAILDQMDHSIRSRPSRWCNFPGGLRA